MFEKIVQEIDIYIVTTEKYIYLYSPILISLCNLPASIFSYPFFPPPQLSLHTGSESSTLLSMLLPKTPDSPYCSCGAMEADEEGVVRAVMVGGSAAVIM